MRQPKKVLAEVVAFVGIKEGGLFPRLGAVLLDAIPLLGGEYFDDEILTIEAEQDELPMDFLAKVQAAVKIFER